MWGIHLTQVTTICWGRAPQAPVISASKLGRQEPVLDRQSSTGVKGSQRDFRVQALTGRHSGPSKALLAAPARVSTTSTHNGLGLPESNGYPTFLLYAGGAYIAWYVCDPIRRVATCHAQSPRRPIPSPGGNRPQIPTITNLTKPSHGAARPIGAFAWGRIHVKQCMRFSPRLRRGPGVSILLRRQANTARHISVVRALRPSGAHWT